MWWIFLLALIPQTVDVHITGQTVCTEHMEYVTVEVPLKEYVKGVLPNEWYPGWPVESLRAGAVAVKQFAVTEYNSQGFLWDCNWDMVYRPGYRTEMTDKAVDDTWNIWLWDDGFIKTYFDDYPSACLSRGQTEDCISQWETYDLAADGYSADEILGTYGYSPIRLFFTGCQAFTH